MTKYPTKQTLKVLIPRLLLVLDVYNVQPKNQEIIGWESCDVVRFDLGPLLQGQRRAAKLKTAYNSLIIGLRGLQYETNLWEIMGWESSDVVRFDLWPLLQGQTMVHWL